MGVKKDKDISLELLRILACFLVVFNHTKINGFFVFTTQVLGSFKFWLYMFFSIFCKVAVPLFFAISGALLLSKKEESLHVLWTKRVARIVLALAVFSFVHYVLEVILWNQNFNISLFIGNLFFSSWHYSYWYLYAYIAFLITLPFLRNMVANLEDKYFYYLFGIGVLFNGIIPVAQYALWQGEIALNGDLRPAFLLNAVVLYPCIGYFLQHRLAQIDKKKVLIMWLVNIAVLSLSCYMTYYKSTVVGMCAEDVSQDFHESFALVNCVTLFISAKYLCNRIKFPKILNKFVTSLGGATFGIYLLHMIFMEKTPYADKIWNLLKVRMNINEMIAAVIFCAIVMGVCYLVTLILKRIPIIRKII